MLSIVWVFFGRERMEWVNKYRIKGLRSTKRSCQIPKNKSKLNKSLKYGFKNCLGYKIWQMNDLPEIKSVDCRYCAIRRHPSVEIENSI